MKEAVVLILDSNETMKEAYEPPKSRFDCAKQVSIDILSDLMIRSKTNEAAVIVLKSPTTKNHFWEPADNHAGTVSAENNIEDDNNDNDIPFCNIHEYGGDGLNPGVNRPHPDILRQIQALEVTKSSKNLQGDFCDGIIVAADALFKRTSGKKYQRRIILITDAEHKVHVDSKQLLVVLDSLRAMECRLEVVGINFESQAEYENAAVAHGRDIVKKGEDAKNTVNDDVDDSATDVSGDDMDEESNNGKEDTMFVKRQNEKLLLSLTEKTGGFVMAAKELRPVLQKILGQRLPRSTRRKVQFQIAPSLSLEARFSLMLSKASTPTLKKRIPKSHHDFDGANGTDERRSQKEEELQDFKTIITHWDPENEQKEIESTVQGYRYGSDIVPMSGYDMTGLLKVSPVKLTILGYLPETSVPKYLRIGPPYALAGADSLKACAAIAALSKAMMEKSQVAVATFVKTRDADPILVGIFPLHESNDDEIIPRRLCMMQLPFRGDVANLDLELLSEPDGDESSKKRQSAENLIDTCMLPPNILNYRHIPNPYVRSFHQTVIGRVLKTDSDVVSVRTKEQDPMATPENICKQSRSAIQAFRSHFPLSHVTKPTESLQKRNKKKSAKSYHDYL